MCADVNTRIHQPEIFCVGGGEGRNWILGVAPREREIFTHTLGAHEKNSAKSGQKFQIWHTHMEKRRRGVCVRMCAIAAEGLFFQSGTNIQRIWPLSSACKLHEHTHTPWVPHRLKAFTALDALYMTSAPPIFEITPCSRSRLQVDNFKFTFARGEFDRRKKWREARATTSDYYLFWWTKK